MTKTKTMHECSFLLKQCMVGRFSPKWDGCPTS